MRTLKLTIAYDGTAYAGWQTQPNADSIQSRIQKAFARVTAERVHVTASGRTDSGVHAVGQVASCQVESTLPTETLIRALNAKLPDDIRVIDVAETWEGFHAIAHSIGKRYRYRIWNSSIPDVFLARTAWHVPRRLNVEAMRLAGSHLLGRKDFACFQAAGSPRRTTVRDLRSLVITAHRGSPFGLTSSDSNSAELSGLAHASTIEIDLEADGFLYNMARNIVGTLVDVGMGKRAPESMIELLESRDRKRAARTAPPHGLTLMQVWHLPPDSVRPRDQTAREENSQ